MPSESQSQLPKVALMSQAEYARHRHVTRQSINELISRKKIPITRERGKIRIDPVAADFALGASIERLDDEDDGDGEAEAPSGSALSNSGVNSYTSNLTRARTATEVYKARLAELEWRTRDGQLIEIENVKKAAAECADLFVTLLNRVPSQRAEELVTAVQTEGVAGARRVLKGIMYDVRVTVHREFDKMAKGQHLIGAD